MDWEPTHAAKGVTQKDQHLRGKRAKWVDQGEMEKRRSEGRCFRYGRTECRRDRYPLKPTRRPQTEAKKAKAKPVIEASLEEDRNATPDHSTDESGKE